MGYKRSADPCMPESALCTNCATPLRLPDPHLPPLHLPSSSEANSTYQKRLPSLTSLLNPGPPPNQHLLSLPALGSPSPSHRGSTSASFSFHPPSLHLTFSCLSLPQQMATRLDTSLLPPQGSRLSSMTPSLILYPTMEARYAKQSPVFARVPSQQRHERSNDDAVEISTLLNISRSSSQDNSSISSTDQPLRSNVTSRTQSPARRQVAGDRHAKYCYARFLTWDTSISASREKERLPGMAGSD